VGVGTWTQLADARHFDGMGGNLGVLSAPLAIVDSDIWFAANIDAQVESPYKLAIELGHDPDYVYSEMFDGGPGMQSAEVVYFDSANYHFIDPVTLATGLHTGEVTFHFAPRTPPSTITLDAGWPGEDYTSSGAEANYTGGNPLMIEVGGLAVDVAYVFVVTTSP